MILAESIYQQSLSLPENIACEVLDFIVFLKQRYAIPTEIISTEDEKRQNALQIVMSFTMIQGRKMSHFLEPVW